MKRKKYVSPLSEVLKAANGQPIMVDMDTAEQSPYSVQGVTVTSMEFKTGSNWSE